MTFLEEIVQQKRAEVQAAQAKVPLDELRERLRGHVTERSFREAITQRGKLSLIAELKRKSPSKGMLRERFDPVSLAQTLQEAGASALSVLTDEPYFGGHLDFLRDVKQFTDIPVLRKDFTIDAYQVYESAFHQADAVLLIVRILTDQLLRELLSIAHTLGLEALVEVHAPEELQRATAAGAGVIGINARDLQTFQLQPRLVEQLVPQIPAGTTIVAESGLETAQDLARMQQLGVQAVLVGEAIMTAPNPKAKVQELLGGVKKGTV